METATNSQEAAGEAILNALGAGVPLRDIRGLSADDVEALYAVGFNLYGQGKYAEAEPVLQLACIYGNNDPRYWGGLAGCRQSLKNFEGAIEAYGFNYFFDNENPWPVIHTAVCYLALSNKELARDSLTLAEKTIALGKADAAATQRIKALRQAL